jgi:O-antigen biosynthesis protein
MTPLPPQPSAPRIVVDGKFFRLGPAKFYLKGLTYGPFAPNAQDEMFPDPHRAAQDFTLIRELGANVLRLYYPPPSWFLDLAHQHALKLLVDIPWPKHLCFLDSACLRKQAREAVRHAVAGHFRLQRGQ